VQRASICALFLAVSFPTSKCGANARQISRRQKPTGEATTSQKPETINNSSEQLY